MKKVILLLIFITMFSTVLSQTVLADGMIYYPDPYDHWHPQVESRQLAAINYEDGFENMLLSIEVTDFQGEEGVWIFPVPAEPEDTVIDIVKGFPNFYGTDIEQRVERSVEDTFDYIRLSQIYTIPLMMFRPVTYGGYAMAEGMQKTAATDASTGVTVHEHIEEMGLTTELITAERGTGVYNYLTRKGLELPEEAKDVLDEYMGEGYSFVVSWISDIGEFKDSSGEIMPYGYGRRISALGVQTTFPTDKIYFPLKPTSVYGSEEIPIELYVTGYVTPEMYPKIEKSAQVNYYYNERFYVTEDYSEFFNNENYIEDFKYTRIELETPSKYLEDDLWIENEPPANIKMADFIVNQVWVWGILVLIICSLFASTFAAMFTYGFSVMNKKKFALFGIANVLSIAGFGILAYLMKIEERYASYRSKTKATQKPLRDIVKLALIISAVVALFLAYSMGGSYYRLEQTLFLFAIIFAPLFLFVVGSIWSYYHSKKLMQFIVIFSVLFLILTYIAEKIMIFAL